MMRSLEHQGVTTIFGYPGGSIMPVFDALYDHRNILNHILVRHEQGAAHAAQGYARVSGEVGVCLVTSGPGATNTVTGIADAMIDSTPIVVIAGQVGTGFLGTDAFQEVDLVGITQPIAKWSYQIRRAEDVPWAVARAFYIARSGRPGPVVLDFAKNAQVEKTKYEPTKQEFIRSYVPVPDTDEESVKAAAELINNAERPLVLVGQGVELGSAQEELRTFIEKADMPAGCTLLGLSALPTDHPLNKGMLGMHGNLGPNINTNKCDVLIAVGMRFDDRVTGNLATYAKQAKVIHFDIDPAEVNKNVKVDIAVLGDCKKTLAAVTGLLKKNRHTEWVDSFKEYEAVEEEKVIRPELHPATDSLSMGEVVRAVSEATRHEAILVSVFIFGIKRIQGNLPTFFIVTVIVSCFIIKACIAFLCEDNRREIACIIGLVETDISNFADAVFVGIGIDKGGVAVVARIIEQTFFNDHVASRFRFAVEIVSRGAARAVEHENGQIAFIEIRADDRFHKDIERVIF